MSGLIVTTKGLHFRALITGFHRVHPVLCLSISARTFIRIGSVPLGLSVLLLHVRLGRTTTTSDYEPFEVVESVEGRHTPGEES